ncbi:MAG: hypothetical protein LVQ75_02600 [Candidatus Babeliales bacterium]|jgi:hypothetical protein
MLEIKKIPLEAASLNDKIKVPFSALLAILPALLVLVRGNKFVLKAAASVGTVDPEVVPFSIPPRCPVCQFTFFQKKILSISNLMEKFLRPV